MIRSLLICFSTPVSIGLRLPVSSASPKAATLYARLDADLSCEMILDGTESQLNFTPSC